MLECPTDLSLSFLSCIFDALFRDTPGIHVGCTYMRLYMRIYVHIIHSIYPIKSAIQRRKRNFKKSGFVEHPIVKDKVNARVLGSNIIPYIVAWCIVLLCIFEHESGSPNCVLKSS